MFAAGVMQRHLVMQHTDFRDFLFGDPAGRQFAGQRLQRPHDRKQLVHVLDRQPDYSCALVRRDF